MGGALTLSTARRRELEHRRGVGGGGAQLLPSPGHWVLKCIQKFKATGGQNIKIKMGGQSSPSQCHLPISSVFKSSFS